MGKTVDDVLAHHGIKGMKWGKRKSESSSSSSASPEHPKSEDFNNKTAINTKRKEGGLSSLSNKELKAAIERMNLEKQYKDLNPSSRDKAKKKGAEIVKKASDQLVQMALSEANKFAMAQIKKQFGAS